MTEYRYDDVEVGDRFNWTSGTIEVAAKHSDELWLWDEERNEHWTSSIIIGDKVVPEFEVGKWYSTDDAQLPTYIFICVIDSEGHVYKNETVVAIYRKPQNTNGWQTFTLGPGDAERYKEWNPETDD